MNKQNLFLIIFISIVCINNISSVLAVGCGPDHPPEGSVINCENDSDGFTALHPNITVNIGLGITVSNVPTSLLMFHPIGDYFVNNSGAVLSSTNHAIHILSSDILTINNSGLVSGGNNGVRVEFVDNFFLFNSGSIIGNTDQMGFGDGLYVLDVDNAIITNTGSIESSDNAVGIRSVQNTIILNSGSIIGNSNALGHGDGIYFGESNSAFITNLETGYIASKGDALWDKAVQMHDTGDNNNTDSFFLENFGLIEADGGAISVSNTQTVDIYNAGIVLADKNANDSSLSHAIYVRKGKGNILLNITNAMDGVIQTLSNGEDNAIHLIDSLDDEPNDSFTLNNAGKILSHSGAIHLNKIDSVNITNSGQIVGNADNDFNFGDGVEILEAKSIVIDNKASGLIWGKQSNAITVVDTLDTIDDWIHIQNAQFGEINGGKQGINIDKVSLVTINNAGFLTAKDEAIITFGSLNAHINNEVTGFINGETIAINTGVNENDISQDYLRNAGIINGDVYLNAGSDKVHFITGMEMNGYVVGGENTDFVSFFDEGASFGEFDINRLAQFEQGQIIDGLWRLSSEQKFVDVPNQFTQFEVGSASPGVNENPILAIHGSEEYTTLSLYTDKYIQHANGSLLIDINFAESGKSDLLDIISTNGSTAYLDGTLEINVDNLSGLLDLKVADGTKTYTVLQVDEIAVSHDEFSNVIPPWYSSYVVHRDIIYNYYPNDKDTVQVAFHRQPYETAMDNKGNRLKYHNDIAWASYQTDLLENNLYEGDISRYLKNLDTTDPVYGLPNYIDKLRAANGEMADVFNQMMIVSNESVMNAISDHLRNNFLHCRRQQDNCAENVTQVWLNVGHRDSKKNEFNEHNYYGVDVLSVISGIDIRLTENLILGGSISYHDASADVNTKSTSQSGAKGDAGGAIWGVDIYIEHRGLLADNFYARALLGYQHAVNLELEREIFIASTTVENSIVDTYDSHTNANSIHGMVEFGWNLQLGHFDITPYTNFSYTHIDVDDFTEDTPTQSSMALAVDFDAVDQIKGELGVAFGANIEAGSARILLQAKPYLTHEFSDNKHHLDTRFAEISENSYSADIESNDGGKTQLGIAGGINVQFKHVFIGVKVDCSAGDDAKQLAIFGKVGIGF